MKSIIKWIMAQTPYRIVRDRGANRFQAIELSLQAMKERGFNPKVIVDGGANVGSFSIDVQKIFPKAIFHLIEPQPACKGPLQKLCTDKGFIFHECALTDQPGSIAFTHTLEPSTGAHVTSDLSNSVSVRADTLDALFPSVNRADRTLLKLDLQGYELHALKGGIKFLGHVEAILAEVSFFSQDYEPPIAELVAFLNNHGFELYDIAALSARFRDNRLRQGDFIFVRSGSELLRDTQWA